MKETAEKLAKDGIRVRYFKGTLMSETHDGRMRRTPGLFRAGTNEVWASVSSARFSPEQIALHEYYHALVSMGKANVEQTVREIREKFSPKEFEQIVEQYLSDYRGAYEGNKIEDIYEELLADAYAGMNRFAKEKSAVQYQDVVRDQIQRGTNENERATRDTRGAPESRFSFAGKLSKTADMEALALAKEMQEQDVDRETILRETGWFVGADGKWRYEIDDSSVRYQKGGDAQFLQDHPEYAEYQGLMEKALFGQLTKQEESRLKELDEIWGREYARLSDRVKNGNATLENILQHEELFSAYPQLRDVKVEFAKMEGGEKGKYDRKNNTITISEELKNRPVTTLLHEIQHVIQKIEGFANGTSPEYWNQKIQRGLEVRKNDKRIQNAEKEYRRIFDSAPKEFKEKIREMNRATIEKDYDTVMRIQDELYESEYAELFSKLDMADFVRRYDRGEILTAEELYRNTAGEIEARDAAVRMDLTADERRNTFPNIGDENTLFADIGEGLDQYSINETNDGRAVAVVDSDILSHMDTNAWDKTKKAKAKKAAKTALLAFKDGVQVNGITYKVNKNSRDEFTRSNDTERLYRKEPEIFAEKLRASANADDIITATTSWAKDGELTHTRTDNFVDFAHGEVLIQAGTNQYKAKTVVGITDAGEYVFYDVVDMKPTRFKVKEEHSTAATGKDAESAIQESSSGDSITENDMPVKQKFSFDDEDYMLAVEAGDMDAAQEMVDEAAQAAGYSVKAIHGTTKNFVEFGNKGAKTESKSAYLAFWFSDSESTSRSYSTPQATDVSEESWDAISREADKRIKEFEKEAFWIDYSGVAGVLKFSEDVVEQYFEEYLPAEHDQIIKEGYDFGFYGMLEWYNKHFEKGRNWREANAPLVVCAIVNSIEG